MKLTKSLFLAFAGLGLFACSNEEVIDNNGGKIDGPADVVVKLNLPNMTSGSRSDFTSETTVTPNYVKITVFDGTGKQIGIKEGVYSTLDDEGADNQFTFQSINNPAKVVVEINTKTGSEGQWTSVNTGTFEELNAIAVADTPMNGETQDISISESGTQYTCTVNMEHTMARLEFGGIKHEEHSGSDKCMFSDGDLSGILLNHVQLTSEGAVEDYNENEIDGFFKASEPVTSPWDKITGTDFFSNSTAVYPSSGCYAYNIYPAAGTENLPVLTLYFSGIATNPEYVDASGNKVSFIGDNGFASVSKYKIAVANVNGEDKKQLRKDLFGTETPTAISGDDSYYQVVNFPAGYIYQVKNLSVVDEAIKTNPTGTGDELVATIEVTPWTIVEGSVDWK